MNNALALGLLKAGHVTEKEVARAEKIKELRRQADLDRRVLTLAGEKDTAAMQLVLEVLSYLDSLPPDIEPPENYLAARALFIQTIRAQARGAEGVGQA